MRKHLLIITGCLIITLVGFRAASVRAMVAPESSLQKEATQQADRITERKNSLAVSIDDDVISRTTNKCESAQVKLGAISTRATDLKRRRGTIYGDLVDQLGTLDTQLSSQKVPHADYHSSVGNLTQTWTTLESTMNDYVTALDDSRSIDCVADPTGFLAALADARKSQVKVLEQNDAFQQQLQVIKQQLSKIKSLVTDKLPEFSLREDGRVVRF